MSSGFPLLYHKALRYCSVGTPHFSRETGQAGGPFMWKGRPHYHPVAQGVFGGKPMNSLKVPDISASS